MIVFQNFDKSFAIFCVLAHLFCGKDHFLDEKMYSNFVTKKAGINGLDELSKSDGCEKLDGRDVPFLLFLCWKKNNWNILSIFSSHSGCPRNGNTFQVSRCLI